MYKAIVIDDEADARNVMRHLIDLFCPQISEVTEAANGAQARNLMSKQPFDFAFIDIELEGESGIELAKEISSVCRNIIFVTAYSQYAVEAFQTQAIHYLLKPVDPELLQQAVQRANVDASGEDMKHRLFLNTKERMTVLQYDEIIYVVGDGNYAIFHNTAGSNLMVSHNLSYYEQLINSTRFYRIHQSYLVNLGFVRGISPRDKQGNHSVDMVNGASLPLARRKKQDFINVLEGEGKT